MKVKRVAFPRTLCLSVFIKQLDIKLRPVRLAEPRAKQTQKASWEEVSAEATASSNRKSFSVLLSPHEV